MILKNNFGKWVILKQSFFKKDAGFVASQEPFKLGGFYGTFGYEHTVMGEFWDEAGNIIRVDSTKVDRLATPEEIQFRGLTA